MVQQPVAQGRRCKQDFWWCQIECGADRQVRPGFPHGSIKGQIGELGRAIGCGQAKGMLVPGDQIAQAEVRDHHAFGGAGGARGIDHVGQLCRGDGFVWIGAAFGGNDRPIPIQADHLWCGGGQVGNPLFLCQQEEHLAILEQEGQTFRRGLWVQREVGATRLENSQPADNHLQRPFHTDPDNDIHTHTDFL